jgi:hypothetical protein
MWDAGREPWLQGPPAVGCELWAVGCRRGCRPTQLCPALPSCAHRTCQGLQRMCFSMFPPILAVSGDFMRTSHTASAPATNCALREALIGSVHNLPSVSLRGPPGMSDTCICACGVKLASFFFSCYTL